MQNYYNSIASTKRVAFVDNLKDNEAKLLSQQYPFAICFTSNIDPNSKTNPVIWYGGQRYGITTVNETALTIGDVTIGLNLDKETGELRLVLAPVISNIDLNNIVHCYNKEYISNNSELVDINIDPITLYSIYNEFIFTYDYYREYNEDKDDHWDKESNDKKYVKVEFNKELRFNNNEYYTVTYNSLYNKYILKINKGTGEDFISISPDVIINNSTVNAITRDFKLEHFPEECKWIVNGQILNNNSCNISPSQSFNIQFDYLQDDVIKDGVVSELWYKTNGTTRINQVNSNEDLYNQLSTILTQANPNSSIDIFIKLKYNNKDKDLNYLRLNIGTSDLLFFIGDNNNVNINNDSYRNPQPLTNLFNNWHILNLNNSNFNNSTQLINDNTVVYLPEGYSLGLPMYEDEAMTRPINDPVFTKTEEYISKYNIKYYKWIIDEQYQGRNDLYFLSIIYKENNI